jgi:hypothetical protein
MTADYEKISKHIKTLSKKVQNKGVCIITATQPPRGNEYFMPPSRATDIGMPDMLFVDYIDCMGY